MPKRQNQKVSISATNIPLENIFKRIYQQTGYSITNNSKETNLDNEKTFSINFVQANINEVMTFLLNDYKNLSYIIKSKEIKIITTLDNRQNDTMLFSFPISGKVVDFVGNPIPGASLKIKNTKRGAISNSDGSFILPEIEKGNIIMISSIGFEPLEITANNSNLTVRLKPQTNNLDERVIIAYGSTTKRLNTGNISSVKAREIETQPVANVLLAMQGRVPGVVIQQSSGIPNSGVSIHIQGLNSLRSGNDPLFVIDGVPYISQLLPIVNGSTGAASNYGISGNPMNYLNPGDVESIEVLKDADATAIYGSRAANGAVLITTKKGKSGNTRADITIQTGWGEVPHMLNLLNTKDYLSMRHEALNNDGIATPSYYDFDLNGSWDTTRNVNWQKELIGKSSQFTNAQANVSGGNSLTQFLIGAAYNKQTTVFPSDFSDAKGSLHFNVNSSSSNQKFKARLSASYMYDQNKAPSTDLTLNAISLSPVAPDLFTKEGTINWEPNSSGRTTYYINPITSIYTNNTNKTNNLTSNLTISYEIIPGLEIKSSMGYSNLTSDETNLRPLTGIYPEDRIYVTRASIFNNNKITSWLVEPQVEYKRNINKGKFSFLFGGTVSQRNSDQSRVSASGFSNDLLMKDLASATDVKGSNINSVYKYSAIYSRITYNWLDKYILNLNARRDGSSRFGYENQFHNFGSIGAAWIFSQEPFIQNALSFLSFGKLRGSYGTTGNDQIQDYLFLDLYQPIRVLGPLYQNSIGLAATRLTNPYLQWEETKKLQFGIEIGLIGDRVLFTANYNQNRSSNQLLSFALPSITGFGSITKNFPAVVQNTGWEFTISTSNIKSKNFTWSTNINLTIPKNKLIAFTGSDAYQGVKLGKSITVQRLFSYIGVNDTTGKYEYRDQKGNLTTTPSDPDDRTSFVSPDPKFYGGFQNTLSYKRFSIDLLFTFCKQIGQDNISYGMAGMYPGSFNYGNGNQSTSVLNRWEKKGDNAKLQPFSTDAYRNFFSLSFSDALWTDASYIKLKNVSISWQLPERWNKVTHLQSSKLFINAQNVFTITKYKGFDPENPVLALPPLRVITFGVQVNL